MKKILYGILSIFMLFVASCKEPQPDVEAPKPEITITEGVITENQIEFYLSATDADEVAYHFQETTDEVPMLTPELLFKNGEVFTASTEPVSFVMENLKPETEYTVYAAAGKEGEYFSEIKELTLTTSEMPKLLQFVSKSKTGFTYKINAQDGQQYLHGYLEGWFFEYMLAMSQSEEGDEFDLNIFVWNLLADNGILGESSQIVDWYTGKEYPTRGDVAYLVPGMKYYVLAAIWDEDRGGWTEDPEVISIQLEEPGKSDKSVNCMIDALEPYKVSVRMEMDADQVSFYMYDFFEKSQYKSYVAENGKEAIMDYVAEYSLGKGQAKINTYTDTWTVDPGTSYMFCLYGVDINGDEFYSELEVNVPLPDASIYLSMNPYERDLENLNTYNTLKVSCAFADFIGLDYESSVFHLAGGPVEKSLFDEVVATAGLSGTIEELQENGEMMYALGLTGMGLSPIVVDDELFAQLTDEGSFEKIYTGLKPDTEYVYMVIAFYDDNIMCRIVSAATDPAPVDVEESEAYKAYLGNWTVTGQNTLTWSNSDLKTFNIRFERLTSNRSYKVYGWSTSGLGQEFPFEASFIPETGKIAIHTPQVLGEVQIEGKTYEVRFVGKNYNLYSDNPDQLIVLPDHEGVAYTGKINEPYLTLLSDMFQYANDWKEYKSMSYVFYDKETEEYFASEEYDLVYFQTQRAE